jgi:fructokinase
MILCCGEALVDMIPARTGDGREAFLPVPGGAALNAAVALARLGCPAGLVAGLSADAFGDQLLAAAAASGVDTAPSAITPRPTALAFVHAETEGPRYAFRDEGSAGRLLSRAELPPLPEAPVATLFGGISLADGPGAAAFEALAAEVAGRGVPVILDLNIRPAAVGDPAAYRARLARMLALSAMVKASDEDLAWLSPGLPPRIAAAALAGAQGPRVVLLTEGARGASALARGEWLSVPTTQVTVADTVGAGDAFIAGVLATLAEEEALAGLAGGAAPETLRAALAFGCRVAAISVTRPGADPPWRKELA